MGLCTKGTDDDGVAFWLSSHMEFRVCEFKTQTLKLKTQRQDTRANCNSVNGAKITKNGLS